MENFIFRAVELSLLIKGVNFSYYEFCRFLIQFLLALVGLGKNLFWMEQIPFMTLSLEHG